MTGQEQVSTQRLVQGQALTRGAAAELSKLAQERQESQTGGPQLSQITKVMLLNQFGSSRKVLTSVETHAWEEEYSAIETEKSTWHIIDNSMRESEQLLEHELVVHLQGILCRHDLPPIQGHIA